MTDKEKIVTTPFVLSPIKVKLDIDLLTKALRIDGNAKYREAFTRLAEESLEVGRPKALYRVVYFDAGDNDNVSIDGISLKSHVLRVNLGDARRIFPFAATCGKELAQWAATKTDMLESFWASAISQSALGSAIHFMRKQIKQEYLLKKTAVMTPGSLEDWPIEEQRPLFAILGDVEGLIGVEVTGSLMMKPVHSVSGILFPTEVSFESCQLCPRPNCPNRRAPYDKHLYENRYR